MSRFTGLPKFGICFDFETSGAHTTDLQATTRDFQGLSLGIIIFDALTFAEVEAKYFEIKFDALKYKWSPEAEKIHGLTREHLAANGETQEAVAEQLVELILKYFGSTPVLAMGHNLAFDLAFMEQLLATIGFDLLDGSRARRSPGMPAIDIFYCQIDTAPLGLATLGVFRSNQLFETYGFDERGLHNALVDASQTLAVAAMTKLIFTEGRKALGIVEQA